MPLGICDILLKNCFFYRLIITAYFFCSHLNILTSKYEYPILISQIIIWHSLPYSLFQFFSTIIHIIQTNTSFHQGVKEEAFRELLTQNCTLSNKSACENVRIRFCYEEPVLWRTIKLKAYTIPLTTSLKLIKNVWNYLLQSTLANISTFCNW